MSHIEQAIFTSAATDRSAGYQVVAVSPGVSPDDQRELAVWGPSHDSLVELGAEAVSVNFHSLPSGAFCVSQTVPGGWEYSGRGGHRIYTHCLIVRPEVLARFANNPLNLLRAAAAVGALEVHQQVPARLEPLDLSGGATAVDQTLLVRLAAQVGPRGMGALVQTAFESACLAVAGPVPADLLIAGFLACLPPSCRTEFSFSTGLKFSSRRPFRIIALPQDPAQQRWLTHSANVTLLDLSHDLPAGRALVDGWARLVEKVLATRRTSFLAAQLSKRRADLAASDLPALGLQLLEGLESSASCPSTGHTPVASQARQSHAAHAKPNGDTARATATLGPAPSQCLNSDSPQVLEKLELLDDAVYDAISGQAPALERLKTLWPAVLADLGDDLVAESRAQYLRYAISLWDGAAEDSAVRDPLRAVQALEVLHLLFQ
jgi:hypothetical protein